ncbi:MAG TPA: hypothetical protein VGZ29_02130 [Terriglobia bacterium]|nr:hypothetical protein [Terriglobia bacterium]
MKLELSPEEHELLLEVLQNHVDRLLWDSARTHRPTFRTEVRAKEELIEGLIAKLKEMLVGAGAS